MIPASTNQLLSYTGYRISRSLRFRSSASAYLSRTPASAGNRQTWTWSGWVKRGALTTDNPLFRASTSVAGTQETAIIFTSDNIRVLDNTVGTGSNFSLVTTQVFRDVSSWYSVIVAVDTTQATNSNRIKVYINGVQVTAFSTSNYPSLSYNTAINNNIAHQLGNRTTDYLDGYLAEVNFIDGQALTPSSFGAFDTNGVWQPAKYTGSYTGNSFYLPFTNSSAIGTDSSGLGNNWTPSASINTTSSGVTYDWMLDSPTNYADGGTGRGNYAVLNPVNGSTNASITEGNLSATGTTANYASNQATFNLTSGKWYFEMTKTTTTAYVDGLGLVVSTYNKNSTSAGDTGSYVITDANPSQVVTKSNGGASVTISTTNWANNDVIQCAYDADSGKVWFGRNGTWYPATNGGTVGDPAAGTNPTITAVSGLTPIIITYNTSSTNKVNFGQRPFTYTPPSGFSALNTQNLPTPTIAAGNKYFDVNTYTGDGTNGRVISGLNLTPDLFWTKARSAAYSHAISDTVRGVGFALHSDTTAAEDSSYGLAGAGTNSYTINGVNQLNASSTTYVAWLWKGGNGTSNIAVNAYGSTPSIASTVSANTSAGFSVVTYTGTGANATVGHGLGVAPSMIIVKNRSTSDWAVYHKSTTAAGVLWLNLTNAYGAFSAAWNSTEPTSTVFSVGTATATNASSSSTHVAYCFAPVAGYSAFGSFSGNGSTDGTFVYTGFRPKFLIMKLTNTTGSWQVKDSSRDLYNVSSTTLYPNLSNAEAADTQVDFLSNGFKLRSATGENASGNTTIYACFAENPFRNARAR